MHQKEAQTLSKAAAVVGKQERGLCQWSSFGWISHTYSVLYVKKICLN